MVVEECTKEHPFVSSSFTNLSTGERYDSRELATIYNDALCPYVRANGNVSSDLLSEYCPECSTTGFDLERCYKDNGLKRVERSGISCKSMRLF